MRVLVLKREVVFYTSDRERKINYIDGVVYNFMPLYVHREASIKEKTRVEGGNSEKFTRKEE